MTRLAIATAMTLALAPMLRAEAVVEAWVQRYNGPGNGEDLPGTVTVDGAGNVIVTGRSRNAGGNDDIYTAKYAAGDGMLLWEVRYDGPANLLDWGQAVAVDGAGNVVVTGLSGSATAKSDIYTAKYAAANGALLWDKRYNGPANDSDGALAMALDDAGNVAVTGFSRNADGNSDYYTAKYASNDGTLLWEARYNGPANRSDQANSIAVDSAGNVTVTGYSRNAANNQDFYTTKYASADGALLWERRYNGLSNGDDVANDVGMDGDGNVFVIGYTAANGYQFYTAKYAASDGAVLWEKRYKSPYNTYDIGRTLAVDHAGNVIVTGRSWDSNYDDDFQTIKYAAANGAQLWAVRYSADQDNTPFSIAVDAVGNVVVAGTSVSVGNFAYNYYTAKYAAANGSLLWEARGPAGTGQQQTGFRQLALVPDGGFVVTGMSLNNDYTTVRYRPAVTYAEWKLGHLGDASAPDLGDPDGDGLETLAEYGINTLPHIPNAAPLAASRFTYPEGERLRLSLQRDPAHNDVTIEVQAAGGFAGPWTTVATSTLGAPFTGTGYVGGDSATPGVKTVEIRDVVNITDVPQRFLRAKVTR